MKKLTKSILCSFTLSLILAVTGCTRAESTANFSLWNDCEALTALKAYVEDVTDKNSKNFIPEEDRIATFDMDGTLIGELYPRYFVYNLLEYRILEDPTYKDKASESEIQIANSIRDYGRKGIPFKSNFDYLQFFATATAYSGMTLKDFDHYVKDFAARPAYGFSGMTFGESFYKPMLEVIDYLNSKGFINYIVSGSDRLVVRSLADSINFPANKVIGLDIQIKADNQGDTASIDYDFALTDKVVRGNNVIIENVHSRKVEQIAQEIGKVPVLSFGNSPGDVSMHNFCLSNKKYKSMAFMLIADDDVRDHAVRQKGLELGERWKKLGYHVISMRDDFKTIYGEGVKTTEFKF